MDGMQAAGIAIRGMLMRAGAHPQAAGQEQRSSWKARLRLRRLESGSPAAGWQTAHMRMRCGAESIGIAILGNLTAMHRLLSFVKIIVTHAEWYDSKQQLSSMRTIMIKHDRVGTALDQN